jgi:hypothetical protein
MLAISCGNSASEGETVTQEVHDHDHSGHNHDHEEENAIDPNSDAFFVPEGARVFFVNLENGAQVQSPFKVEMGMEGMQMNPAGEIIRGTGHHHILINKKHMPMGETIPADEIHLHYGKAQTEAELDLAPGEYELTLQFANGFHQSYGEQMSAKINISVLPKQ